MATTSGCGVDLRAFIANSWPRRRQRSRRLGDLPREHLHAGASRGRCRLHTARGVLREPGVAEQLLARRRRGAPDHFAFQGRLREVRKISALLLLLGLYRDHRQPFQTQRVVRAKFLAERGIDVAPLNAAAEQQRAKSATVIFVALDRKLAGFVAIADPIKQTTPAALKGLRDAGIRIVMLTGDGRTTAETVGKELGIDEVVAEIFPEDKATIVQRLRSEGRVVAMAGDGVNDAPALSSADVGIAMGTGTDVAMESAGITLLKGDLMGIVRARKLSQATMKNIRQNLFLSFAYNVAGIPLAAGVLYPFFGLLLSPVVAAAAMALSSVSVIANALRLRTVKVD
ncbi:HAD-IC family P-type ATPase [Variovorax sp. RT4R15]|uniref:HAD-IC family P-type ATPase n=1 Tax=Variovorax sp. RT4R15 TaxID=3443737 RepID=UPI003F455C65